MKKLPKAILFDWDNTILDSKTYVHAAITQTLKEMRKSVPDNNTLYSGPRLQYFKHNFGNDWEEAERIFIKNMKEIPIHHMNIFDGIIDVLKFLQNKNIYTAIVSNKESSSLLNEVLYFKLEKFFDKIVGSGDTLFDKPSREPLIFALDGSNLTPNKKDVLFIGDSVVDMECAENSNVTGIIFNSTIPSYSQNMRVENFSELLQLLQELGS